MMPDAPLLDLSILSDSADLTRSVGAALSGVVRPGDTVLLVGAMGAGKTVFAQGFAAGLGVQGPVTSPTFTLVREYPCRANTAGVRLLIHADMYRLDSLDEMVDLGLPELVEDEAVALVEWGDLAATVLGTDPMWVQLCPADDPECERTITVVVGERWSARAESLREALAPFGAALSENSRVRP
jgi:tRNA threonylcarbamoyladenosine biosynthesis protein TsaE